MDKALVVRGIFMGLSALGCIGTMGVAGFELKDNIDAIKDMTKDVKTEVPTVKVKEA